MFEFGYTVYERIINILELQKIPKTEFYTKLALSRSTVQKWRKGSIPNSQILAEIAEYLDVSLFWLITGKDNQNTTKPDSPAQIVNRIKYRLEELSEVKQYDEKNIYKFYAPLHECIKPYQLTKWFYGAQIPTIKQLNVIAQNIHMSLQELITGSKVPPEDYDKYFNSDDNELNQFHKSYNCLTDDNRKIVNKLTYSLFLSQDYHYKVQQLEEQKRMWEIMNNPYEDPNSSFEAGMED